MEDLIRDEFQDNDSSICCRICGYQAKIITPSHLKIHSTTMEDYRKTYPNAPVVCEDTKRKLTKTSKDKAERVKIAKTQTILNEIQRSPKIESLPKIEIKGDNIVKKIDNLIICNISSDGEVSRDKAEILYFLQNRFGGDKVFNNYYVEKMIVNQYLEYKIITDIAIPSLKIDLEFPNCFWHNSDVRRPKDLRDIVLKRDGWRVIDITNVNPNSEDVKLALDLILQNKNHNN